MEQITIKDCFYMIAASWNSIEISTNNISKTSDELNSESDSEENSVMRKEVLDNFNINIGQIEELLADDDCNTFKVLTDKEIIEVVQESTADEPEEAMDS
ncbi:hypothetical protein T4A_7789 [Trichinella pseudospiralis]|uniref:Uncharacterized protein n=1 Tax=Trichinella pseudospiralis TaxID=6337 RepID=A0A0V1EQB4_TRIPS|nr:hypothetical protein T4A_7789 [Trichinella pseudospiralis]